MLMNYDRLKNIYKKNENVILPIKPGMLLEIHENVWDRDAKRIWKFKGLVIKVKKPNHPDGTFTIRGDVARMTIEKIYPLSFPNFEKVLVLDEYKIRRSKLYYIRDKVGKDARFKSGLPAGYQEIDLLEQVKSKMIKKDKIEPVEKKDEQQQIKPQNTENVSIEVDAEVKTGVDTEVNNETSTESSEKKEE